MGIVRDLYYARKIGAGTKLPAPTVALLVKRLALAAGMGGEVVATVSGNPAHITNALARAAVSVLATIFPIQDLHGYDHPWPAGGGKNKLPTIDESKTINGVNWELNNDGSVTLSGTASVNSVYDFGRNILTLSAGTYTTFDSTVTGAYTVTVFKVVSGTSSVIKTGGGLFTLSEDTSIFVRYVVPIGTTVDITIHPQVEPGSAPTTYAPYSNICPISGRTGLNVYVSPTTAQADATTYAVDWTDVAGTVYGGTLDVVTGVLTATHAMKDFGNPTWTKYASYHTFVASISDLYPVDSTDYARGIICSVYPSVNYWWSSSTKPDFSISHAGTNTIAIKDSSKDSLTVGDFKTAMSGVQLVYELATPLTYQLTAQEVELLLGENYVWLSSGDIVSVTYYSSGNANNRQALNILLGGNYTNNRTSEDVSDKEALDIILGGNK